MPKFGPIPGMVIGIKEEEVESRERCSKKAVPIPGLKIPRGAKDGASLKRVTGIGHQAPGRFPRGEHLAWDWGGDPTIQLPGCTRIRTLSGPRRMILRLKILCQGGPTFSLRDPGQKTWGGRLFSSDPRYPVLRLLACVLGFWRPLVLSPKKIKQKKMASRNRFPKTYTSATLRGWNPGHRMVGGHLKRTHYGNADKGFLCVPETSPAVTAGPARGVSRFVVRNA